MLFNGTTQILYSSLPNKLNLTPPKNSLARMKFKSKSTLIIFFTNLLFDPNCRALNYRASNCPLPNFSHTPLQSVIKMLKAPTSGMLSTIIDR